MFAKYLRMFAKYLRMFAKYLRMFAKYLRMLFQSYVHTWLHTKRQPTVSGRQGAERDQLFSAVICTRVSDSWMRQDFETADKVLPTVPREHRTRVAHFLEKQVQCHFVVISEKSPQYKSWGNLGSNIVFNYTEPK